MLKTIGMILILTASGTVGLGMARTVRRQQVQTVALIDALLRLRHELQYKMTPLPDAFAVLAETPNREVASFFSALSDRLQSSRICTVGYACRKAMAQTSGLQLTAGTRSALLSLFDALGRYDLEGNLQVLELALERLRAEARLIQSGSRARCRTYISLAVCTGLAIAVILV